MTVSDLHAATRAGGREPRTIAILFLILSLSTTAAVTHAFAVYLPATLGAAPWVALVGLFAVLSFWISANFWLSAIGATSLALRRNTPAVTSKRPIGRRLAVLMPVYEEDAGAVLRGLDAVWRALEARDRVAGFHLFVLSDTRTDRTSRRELAALRVLRRRHGAEDRIFYRRRDENRGRKAGNIQDFVEQWGAAYDYALVLDADSRMGGAAVERLADMLDADPELALVQTWTRPVRATTPFGRLQQFAASVFGQQVAEGLSLVMGRTATYWGHNAMIRVRAFAACCGLPELPGRVPLGGEVLSHDFVEAAMLTRAGWSVRIVSDRLASFEEPPPSLIDHAARDRRWCQGNLQHLHLLAADRIGWSARLHFLSGALAYLSAPLWLLFLVLGVGAYVAASDGAMRAGGDPTVLIAAPLTMLFAPKLMGAALVATDPELRRGHGGGLRLAVGVLLEAVVSALTAPVMMLLHARFVAEILAGFSSGWRPGKRAGEGETLLRVLGAHWMHLVAGIVATAIVAVAAPGMLALASPVLAGLLVAVPLSWAGSLPALGGWLRRCGLFAVPEEMEPPSVLVDRRR